MTTMGAVAIWRPIAAPPRGAAESGPADGGALRLTRRGRLARSMMVLVLGAALLVVCLAWLTGAPARAGSDSGASVRVETVTVEPGDSLWVIAQRIAPGHDPRDVVHHLRELNGLGSNLIQPGQELLLPSNL